MDEIILAIDQGTSSTKVIAFNKAAKQLARVSVTIKVFQTKDGHIEQNPNEIFESVLKGTSQCLSLLKEKGYKETDIVGIGIANQRETFVLWEEKGKCLTNAISWQCKRSEGICKELNEHGYQKEVSDKTGLILNSYFSATKITWLLRNDLALADQVKQGKVYFGTIDTYLLWRLTDGKAYLTDHTNASRTLLFNIHTLEWDESMIALFGLTGLRLPDVKFSADRYGNSVFEGLFTRKKEIVAMIGDSHAAAFGEGCVNPGDLKVTMGTGSSVLMNTAQKIYGQPNGLMSTICWTVPGRIDYALEGVIVSCGSILEWMKNDLELFKNESELADFDRSDSDVFFIPALSGLGTPFWNRTVEASWYGLTFKSGRKDLLKAGVDAISFQVIAVLEAMQSVYGDLGSIACDGGVSKDLNILETIGSCMNISIRRFDNADVTALGSFFMACFQLGIVDDLKEFQDQILSADLLHPVKAKGDQIHENYRKWYALVEQKICTMA